LSSDQYRPLIIAYGAPVVLSDVASVIDGADNVHQAAWMNTVPAIIVNVQRQPGSKSAAVAPTRATRAACIGGDCSARTPGLFPWAMFWLLIDSNWFRLSDHKRGWFVRVHSLGPSLSRSSDTRNQPGDWDVS